MTTGAAVHRHILDRMNAINDSLKKKKKRAYQGQLNLQQWPHLLVGCPSSRLVSAALPLSRYIQVGAVPPIPFFFLKESLLVFSLSRL